MNDNTKITRGDAVVITIFLAGLVGIPWAIMNVIAWAWSLI